MKPVNKHFISGEKINTYKINLKPLGTALLFLILSSNSLIASEIVNYKFTNKMFASFSTLIVRINNFKNLESQIFITDTLNKAEYLELTT